MEQESDRYVNLSAMSAVIPPLCYVCYSPKLWIVTERTRQKTQEAEIRFLCRVAGLSLRDRMRSSVIYKGLRVELLLLYIKGSQMG